MLLKRFLIVFALVASHWLQAQDNDIIVYINTYKELAICEMQRTGVPASITLAQGIHETMAGKSPLVLKSNNHFGIKCKSSWTGDKVYHDDDRRGECFRSYTSSTESYTDHSDFLKNNARYASLFTLNPTDYKEWAIGLKKAGYATNVRYPDILIKLIEEYNLQQYSLIALGEISPKDEILVGSGRPLGDVTFIHTKTTATVTEVLPALPVVQYPSGEFSINHTKVIFAKAGTSLLAIANDNKIPLGRLIDFNDMREQDVLSKDQLLYLQRKRKTGANEFHEVRPGESLYDICQAEGIRFESLLAFNHLNASAVPAAGEKLYCQSTAPSMPKLTEKVVMASMQNTLMSRTNNTAVTSSTAMHTVQSSETLFSIARKYGVTVAQLREWNKLPGQNLKPGQELVIHKN